jgi:hypothetical protein
VRWQIEDWLQIRRPSSIQARATAKPKASASSSAMNLFFEIGEPVVNEAKPVSKTKQAASEDRGLCCLSSHDALHC